MAKILIVDDAAYIRFKVAKMLRANGHEVVEAQNGKEALEKYAQEKPDMVLMDITMPEMDGITAVKELKKTDPAVKIAMLSAMGQQQTVIEAIKAGAKEFILKPVEPDQILSAVSKLIK